MFKWLKRKGMTVYMKWNRHFKIRTDKAAERELQRLGTFYIATRILGDNFLKIKYGMKWKEMPFKYSIL